jgi:hypothetical protein
MPPAQRPSTGLKASSSQQAFSWLSILLFGLIFLYGLMGLFRVTDFNVWGSLGLTLPATICGVLGQANRLRSLTASLLGSHLAVTMHNPDNAAPNSRDQRSCSARKSIVRNGERNRQTDEGESHAQKSP